MKRIVAALGIAAGVLFLAGMVIVGVTMWPVLQDGNEAKKTASAIAAAMQDNWSEEKFAFYASPRLLALNPNWKADLTTIQQKLGKIQTAAAPRNGKVVRDETLPNGVIYEIFVDLECEKGPATMRIGLARFEPGFRMTAFFVEDRRGNLSP